jgi:single-strand DNA-binding protein
MASLNKVMLIGNVGTEPEMRFTPNGNPVTSFSVATNRTLPATEGSERKEETEWFSIVAWNKLAETCNQFLTKGRSVYVEGRLHTRSWEKDGQKHYKTEVIANTVLFLGKPGASAPLPGEPAPEGTTDVEDLPF